MDIRILKWSILFLFLNLYLSSVLFAETIVLKSGKSLIGKILEKTDQSVKIEFAGIEVTYTPAEVDTIDGVPMASYSIKRDIEPKEHPIADLPDAREAPVEPIDPAQEEADYKKIGDLLEDYSGGPELKEAKQIIDKILAKNPNSVRGLAGKARSMILSEAVWSSRKNTPIQAEALTLLKKAVELDPDFFDAYITMGFIYAFRSDYNKAQEMLEKAKSLDPGSLKTLFLSAFLEKLLGHFEKSIEMAQMAYQKSEKISQKVRALRYLSQAYEKANQMEAANDAYLKIIDMQPELVLAKHIYIKFLISIKEFDKAIEWGKKTMLHARGTDFSASLAMAYQGKGYEFYWNQKKYDEGVGFYKLAVKYCPQLPDLYYTMADYQRIKGNLQKAVEYYKKELKNNPQNADAQKDLDRTLAEMGH